MCQSRTLPLARDGDKQTQRNPARATSISAQCVQEAVFWLSLYARAVFCKSKSAGRIWDSEATRCSSAT